MEGDLERKRAAGVEIDPAAAKASILKLSAVRIPIAVVDKLGAVLTARRVFIQGSEPPLVGGRKASEGDLWLDREDRRGV
jgi:hypothetical protein